LREREKEKADLEMKCKLAELRSSEFKEGEVITLKE